MSNAAHYHRVIGEQIQDGPSITTTSAPYRIIRIYEPEDTDMWMAELHDSMGRLLATASARSLGQVLDMIKVLLPVEEDERE